MPYNPEMTYDIGTRPDSWYREMATYVLGRLEFSPSVVLEPDNGTRYVICVSPYDDTVTGMCNPDGVPVLLSMPLHHTCAVFDLTAYKYVDYVQEKLKLPGTADALVITKFLNALGQQTELL